MIPASIQQAIQQHFKTEGLAFRRVGGGSINQAFSFQVGNQIYFLKFNDAQKHPKIIEHEVEGLYAIEATRTIQTPNIVFTATLANYEVLVLPFITTQQPDHNFWKSFGQQLAAMHQTPTANQFGWHHDNYLGSLPQSNTWNENFNDFWVNHRIEPQLKLALDNQLLSNSDLDAFELLFDEIGSIFPPATPSLVHGDLWSGNFIANNQLGPILIDPAIHYSFAETDIAFTHLFAGYDDAFYSAYHAVNPFELGFNSRINIYNLYPLLLHLNLFGTAYYSNIRSIISQFKK